MKSVCQHCGEKHSHRNLAEFDFRYNTRTKLGFNDLMRAEALAEGVKGKRLTYRRPQNRSIESALGAKQNALWLGGSPMFNGTLPALPARFILCNPMLWRRLRHHIDGALKT
jgi:hypothetical protein